MNLLQFLRPLARIFPSVTKPLAPLKPEQRTIYTAITLFIYLICCQIPLYGIQRSYDSDPLYWARVILASSRGTLMQFGISPIISAGWIIQIASAIGFLKIHSEKDEKDAQGIQKILALIFCFGQATGSIWYGTYGQPSQMSFISMALIVIQLMFAGAVVILLDDLLRKGYGLGSGISLFILTNTAQQIFWACFSPVTMSSQFGIQFEGSIIALVHFLYTKPFWQAITQAFTRQNGPNLSQLLGAFTIFIILIYLQRFKANVTLIHQKYPGYEQKVPVKLFFTSNMSVILQSMLISNFYRISSILHQRFVNSTLIKLIGAWENNRIVGGIIWYIAPPYNLEEAITYPHRTILYTVFVCFLCSIFAKFWLIISKTTPADYAKQLRSQELTLPNYNEESVIERLEKTIPAAATLGGVIIGFLTVVGDLLNVTGSSAGILLSITILYGYYQKMKPTQPILTDF